MDAWNLYLGKPAEEETALTEMGADLRKTAGSVRVRLLVAICEADRSMTVLSSVSPGFPVRVCGGGTWMCRGHSHAWRLGRSLGHFRGVHSRIFRRLHRRLPSCPIRQPWSLTDPSGDPRRRAVRIAARGRPLPAFREYGVRPSFRIRIEFGRLRWGS
jgi:hypothetical protein